MEEQQCSGLKAHHVLQHVVWEWLIAPQECPVPLQRTLSHHTHLPAPRLDTHFDIACCCVLPQGCACILNRLTCLSVEQLRLS